MPPTDGERLARIEERLIALQAKVDGFSSTLRWLGFTLGGAVLAAAGQFIINGGLSGV